MKLIATRKHIAEQLGFDSRWVTKQLKRLGITHRGALTPLDVALLEKQIGSSYSPTFLKHNS